MMGEAKKSSQTVSHKEKLKSRSQGHPLAESYFCMLARGNPAHATLGGSQLEKRAAPLGNPKDALIMCAFHQSRNRLRVATAGKIAHNFKIQEEARTIGNSCLRKKHRKRRRLYRERQ